MKVLTDRELAEIVSKAILDQGIDCADAYKHFLEGLGDLVADTFGGTRGLVTFHKDDCSKWTVAFEVNESVPDDGGIFKNYDYNVIWEGGEEK